MSDKSICELMEEFRPIIDSLIDRTLQTNREQGFLVCKEDDDLSIAGVCEGTSCQIKYMKDCEGKDVGVFHTHPRVYERVMSGGDTIYAIDQNHDFSCVGTRMGVKCWTFDKSSPLHQEIKEGLDEMHEDGHELVDTIDRFNEDLEAYKTKKAAGEDVELERTSLRTRRGDIKRLRRRYMTNRRILKRKARDEYPSFTKECEMKERPGLEEGV